MRINWCHDGADWRRGINQRPLGCPQLVTLKQRTDPHAPEGPAAESPAPESPAPESPAPESPAPESPAGEPYGLLRDLRPLTVSERDGFCRVLTPCG